MSRRRMGAALLVLTCTVVSCGKSAPTIVFDSIPPDTTEPPATVPTPPTVIPLPAITISPPDSIDDAWRDATGNLAGLRSECGAINYVAPHPAGGLLTAVSLRGMWATGNGGQSWFEIGTGDHSESLTLRLTSVEFDPHDSDRFWVTGVYNGAGVYGTVDGGVTFTQLGDVFNIVDLSIDFTDAQRNPLVAVDQDKIGVWKSIDGGETWQSIDGGLPDQGGRTTGVVVVDRDTYVVGVTDGSVPGVFRTIDGGENWVRVHPAGVAGHPVRTASGDLVWLLERGGGLITSVDDGATWTAQDGRGISPFASSLVELPDGRLVTFSSSRLLATQDKGQMWSSIGPAIPFEPLGITYSQLDGAFYAWTDKCDATGSVPVQSGTVMRLDFVVQR